MRARACVCEQSINMAQKNTQSNAYERDREWAKKHKKHPYSLARLHIVMCIKYIEFNNWILTLK